MIYLDDLNRDCSVREFWFFQIHPSDKEFINEFRGMSFYVFREQIMQELIDGSFGVGVHEGDIPETYTFLLNNDEYIGLFRIRHDADGLLNGTKGNIDFYIIPEARHKGYASYGLRLAIGKLLDFEDFHNKYVYLSCAVDDIASRIAILHNCGDIYYTDTNRLYFRISVLKFRHTWCTYLEPK